MTQEGFEYLKSESYYSDLYDRFTVEECRRLEKSGVSEDYAELEDKPKKNKIKRALEVKVFLPTALYFVKGERYTKKAETVGEWMAQDKAKDDLLASARPLDGIQCLTCGSVLIPNFRNLQNGWPDKKDRVLFMYDCPKGCLPRRAFFDNGEEWRPRSHHCSKCNGETDEKNERKGNIITYIYTCPKCGYKEEDVLDLDEKPKPESIDPDFVKDRQRFCMSSEEGSEYIGSRARLKDLPNLIKEAEEKGKTQKELAGIKKLTVIELEKLLTPVLEKESYIHLQLANPEIDRNVVVPFTVQDSKSGRESRVSEYDLRRLFKKALEDTNWRLMSDDVNYRLGVLSGYLRGYENEEDLLKLA